MKKILIGLVALFAASSVFANGGEYEGNYASSGSFSGTHAGTSAIGGGYSVNGSGEAVTGAPGWGEGYSYQGSFAGATNTTSAGALSNTTNDGSALELGAGVSSEGSTYSYSDGIQGGAGFGTTSGRSFQFGMGHANAGGSVDAFSETENGYSEAWGHGSVNSFAGQVSGSFTSNTNNGSAGAESHGFAYSSNIARLEVEAGNGVATAMHDVDSAAEAGGSGATRAEDGGSSIAGGGGYADGSASTWADTHTYSEGGDYEVPCASECGDPGESKGNNGFGNGPDGHPPGHFKNGGGAHRGQDEPN